MNASTGQTHITVRNKKYSIYGGRFFLPLFNFFEKGVDRLKMRVYYVTVLIVIAQLIQLSQLAQLYDRLRIHNDMEVKP